MRRTYREYPLTIKQREVRLLTTEEKHLTKQEEIALGEYDWISLHWREFSKLMEQGECQTRIMRCLEEIFNSLRGQLYDVIESSGIPFADSQAGFSQRLQGDALKDLVRGFLRQAEENIKDFPYLHIKE